MTSASLPDAVSGHRVADTLSRRPMAGAVLAMTLCAGALIASEFLPVSLLTPVAADLHLTEGQAGQAISVSGLFAVVTSLFASAAVGRLDRRTVLLGFALLMVASGTIVALAPSFAVLTVGRALLGVAIGGFWSMSMAVVMRLVARRDVPRALALIGLGHVLIPTLALLAAWGLVGTPAPVGWGTWLSRTLPDEAEAGGGLMVATIQLGITLGASVGGLLFDASGWRSTFGASAAMLSASALLALLCWRATTTTIKESRDEA